MAQRQSDIDLRDILTQDEIDEKAWKYIGYRGFTSFVSSDADLFVLRRFDKLNSRILLSLQATLGLHEGELDDLDRKYSSKRTGDINNGSVRDDQPDRVELLHTISRVLQEPEDSLLLSYSDVKSRPAAPKRNITNVENWFYNNDGAIVEEDRQFITHKYDLVQVSREQKATMRRFLEDHIVFRLHWLWRMNPPSGDLAPTDEAVRRYADNDRIGIFTTAFIFVVGLVMLLAPIWVLAVLSNSYVKLGVISAFIVAFLVMIIYGTVAKPFESLAATAAYAAVLMVFLQLGNSS